MELGPHLEYYTSRVMYVLVWELEVATYLHTIVDRLGVVDVLTVFNKIGVSQSSFLDLPYVYLSILV